MEADVDKKCYIVSLELEVLVVAESPEEAKRIARDSGALRDDLNNNEHRASSRLARCIPGDWNETNLVYHSGNGDITVPEAMALNGL